MPIVAATRPGTRSETTRTPFARTVFSTGVRPSTVRTVPRASCSAAVMRAKRGSTGSAGLFAERFLPRQTDLAGLVDLEDLHHHLIALVDDVAHLLHALVRELRDVHQPIRPGEDLDEGAEVH